MGGAAVEAQQLLGPWGLLPAVGVRQLAGGPHLTQGGCALEALRGNGCLVRHALPYDVALPPQHHFLQSWEKGQHGV